MKNCKKFFRGFLVIMTNFWRGCVVSGNIWHGCFETQTKLCRVGNSPPDCFQGSLCCVPLQGGAVVFAPPRNAFAFLTSCSVLDDMRLRAQERDFAVLLKLTCGQLRPKGSALWTSAAFEKAGETFPYWTFRFAAFLLLL